MNSLTFLSQPRGLHNFINEIKSAVSKEDERKRVDKELANIRFKFANSNTLQAYHKKKYIWKICYIYMLGYEVDFGYVEVISLLGATKYTEKCVAYMALSLLIRPGDQLMSLVINSIRNDLNSPYNWAQSLALGAICNIGGAEFTETLSADVQRLLIESIDRSPFANQQLTPENEQKYRSTLMKKACLCMLRFYRTDAERFDRSEDTMWIRVLAKLLDDRDMGVITSAMSLLLGFASNNPTIFEPLIPYVVSLLTRLSSEKSSTMIPSEYMYERMPSPWLTVKCLRYLQYYKVTDQQQIYILHNALSFIVDNGIRTSEGRVQSQSNAGHAILLEAISLVVTYGSNMDISLRESSNKLLGHFLTVKDANIRYLGIDAIIRIARLEGPASVQNHQATVLLFLEDTDISVRKRALALLYLMADDSNALDIVQQLVQCIPNANAAMKEEMVVKIAILAERYAGGDFSWYVDTMLSVIIAAGDHVGDSVWHRVVLIVTNHSDIHDYTAEKMLKALGGKHVHETAVALAAYILGEIGLNICDKKGMSGIEQFATIHNHFPKCSQKIQALLLTTYVKFLNLYPDTKEYVLEVFDKYSTSSNLELQQRACEYRALPSISSDIMEQVLNPMPQYSIDKESSLLVITETDKPSSDRSTLVALKTESSPKPASTSPAVSHVSIEKQVHVDLLSLDDVDDGNTYGNSSSSSNDSQSNQSNGTATSVKNVDALFLAAVMTPKTQRCLLYDDRVLEVSLVSDYRAHAGRLSLYLVNVSSAAISDLRVSIPSFDHLVIKSKDAQAHLACREETVIQIAVDCMRPYADAPVIRIAYNNTQFSLKLPILPTCFSEPLALDKATYMSRWKSMEADKAGEVQVIVTSSKQVTPELMNHIRTVVYPALGIGLATELDTDMSATGCCQYRTGTKGQDGNSINVGALLRIDGDKANNRFRLTVRAKHPIIAKAINDVITAQIV